MNISPASTETMFLHYGYVTAPAKASGDNKASVQLIGTLVSNFAYYGYVPSKELLAAIQDSSKESLSKFWSKIESALKANSGEGRNIGKHVVYKNFPKEVLDMDQGQYWFNQILMYFGLPNDLFTQEEVQRDAMFEDVKLKVLHVSGKDTFLDIFKGLMTLPNTWTDMQRLHAEYTLRAFGTDITVVIDMDTIGFKANGIHAILFAKANGLQHKINITTATDVLRLAAGMSGGDVTLRTKVKFAKFKRSERRMLVNLMESAENLEDDLVARKDDWKKLLMILHPGDFKATRVMAAYDKLYKGELKSFASKVDPLVIKKAGLATLASRPGEFLRRFHKMYELFGSATVEAFNKIVPKLTTQQLVKFDKYVSTVNDRKTFCYAPNGNWTRLQVAANSKTKITSGDLSSLQTAIGSEIRARLGVLFPEGIDLDEATANVKLQTNDQKLASYGRGTSFPIPENIKFIRGASYWGKRNDTGYGNTWMDNGFNFFDENWLVKGTVCWNAPKWDDAAVFSGDPTNSKTADGKATQVIDLYLDKLQAKGVRYIVWNILSYNGIPFDSVDDIYASLQWGEDAFSGKIYEPSRAQMEFQVTGANQTKFIAYIDLVERKLIYMDANLHGVISSAVDNSYTLQEKMPVMVDYLNALPSVFDLFKSAKTGTTPVVYSDADKEITSGSAFVFRKENADNSFKSLDLNVILE